MAAPQMDQFQRAAQLWAVLVLAARNQQILSYTTAEGLTGLDRRGIGNLALGPIYFYCAVHKLPPLTALVVEEDTGLPGDGFLNEAQKDFGTSNIFELQARVFVHNWFKDPAPTPDDFESAKKRYKKQP